MTSSPAAPAIPRCVAATAAAASALALAAACTSSPKTTYTDDAGREVTVTWADYPGEEGQDADLVRRAPTQVEVEELSVELFAEIEAALATDYDLDWQTRSLNEGQVWFPSEGNGYGGESAYVLYNSPQRLATGVPADPAEWDSIVATVDAVLVRRGFDPVDVARYPDGDDRSTGAAGAGTAPQWDGFTMGDAGTFGVGLTGAVEGGAAAAEDSLAPPARSISLFYGVTTIADDERASFDERLAPFEGLDQPPATHSD